MLALVSAPTIDTVKTGMNCLGIDSAIAGSTLAPGRRGLLLAALLLISACGKPEAPVSPSTAAGEWREFGGSWTASGTRRTLHLDLDHRAAIFDLTGSLLLTGAQRPSVGFRAEAVGFTDSRTGMEGRCIWTDERGDKVFSDLKGEFVGSGNRITGTFTGGTGRYAGVTGEYSFQWQYVVDTEDGAVSGRAIGLKGRARIASPTGAPGK